MHNKDCMAMRTSTLIDKEIKAGRVIIDDFSSVHKDAEGVFAYMLVPGDRKGGTQLWIRQDI
ncbi:hypothetical protein LOZ80_19965 [Paenibacillus sp. HWE-109]|uniref:hypothetical protein n=1 Tax=Paenibacillus sp. HWE-109 TaxID=1306526 RepID=UPI001EDD2570|nr:hypothetical protein [Paenibacillus sp. HWE-109]UKS23921.1 hypothetical protein LOZ80_19965 [Paenibacillus sp. HWE-109]